MQKPSLDYFKWAVIADGIVEVSVNPEVELKAEHITNAFDLVGNEMPGKFCVLAHRLENYSHSLESMVKLSEIEDVLLYAVVVHNDLQRELAQSHRLINTKVKLYGKRKDALQACLNAIEKNRTA